MRLGATGALIAPTDDGVAVRSVTPWGGEYTHRPRSTRDGHCILLAAKGPYRAFSRACS